MNYFEKIQTVLEEKDLANKRTNGYFSDATYGIFEEILFDLIPSKIQSQLERIEEKKASLSDLLILSFNFLYDVDIQCPGGFLCKFSYGFLRKIVNFPEMQSYLSTLPYEECKFINDKSSMTLQMSFDLRILINFYYQELQRQEYNIGLSK